VFENLDLIPADINLVGAEIELINSISRETILKEHLESIRGHYEYIFFGLLSFPRLVNRQ